VNGIGMNIQHRRTGFRDHIGHRSNQMRTPALGHVGDPKERHARGTVEEMSDQGYSVQVSEGYDEAVISTRVALRGEGFSILTEMHVGGLLGPQAAGGRQYLIMGSWDSANVSTIEGSPDLRVATHLPCNVVVHEGDSGTQVSALDPTEGIDAADTRSMRIAGEARDALERALTKISSAAR
jgi:uncharacterized protein (DUF302 family)